MKIAIIGTGMVGRALAGKLVRLGHDVVIGTRDVAETLARREAGAMGTPPYAEWQKDNAAVRLVPFAAAGAHGEIVINATGGAVSLSALQAVGEANLAGKVLIDIALPLDFSEGMPPKLTIANTDSLSEQIQRAFPKARVVKTLNTVFKDVMIEPSRVPGPHNIFVVGNDHEAKETAKTLLYSFGWRDDVIVDLGAIHAARAVEMYMQLYFTLAAKLETFDFNIQIARAA